MFKNLLTKYYFVVLIFGINLITDCSEEIPVDPADYVNPFIGTAATGHTFPGASRPFGMVQLGPDNGETGDKHYNYSSESVIGFSHTHLSGTGTGTLAKYANVLFMPTTGVLQIKPGTADSPDEGYRSRFSHDEEEASPGYYSVRLKDYDINVEVTATERAGMHRYVFPCTDEGHIIIDITRFPTHGRQDLAAIEIIGDQALAGSTTVLEREGNITFTWYFYAELSRPFDSFGTFSKGEPVDGRRTSKGKEGVGAYLNIDTEDGEQILVRVGISFTSIEGAKRNLRTEIPSWDFDGLRAAASADWNSELSRVKISGGTQMNRVKFYTALYHSLMFPRTFSDADSSWYSHFTDSIHSDSGFTYYVDFSLWDTYRAVHPLFTILEPERQTDMIKTLLTMYDQGGRIPLQTSYRNFYSDVMIGDHGSAVILDSYLKGLRDYDTEKAWSGMRRNAFEAGDEDKSSREGLESYQDLRYIAADRVRESVSLTLEDCYVDWGLAQVAKDMGREGDYRVLMERSGYYRNLYDKEIGFFRPRLAPGEWLPECFRGQRPEVVSDGYNCYYDCWDKWWIGVSPNRHYTESNAWQYLWYVPHDVAGLIELMGGKAAFVERLDEFFTISSFNSGPFYGGVTGVIGQYVHGNEPSHHVPYLYNYAGAAWKTQERVREIMEYKYGIDSRGILGNDDMGQMSAWFVFSALGFYPVAPGDSKYQIGSPLFENVVIELGDYYGNRTFTVIARNNSGDNKYIQSATLNGKSLERTWITHSEITEGGELLLEMGPEPNKHLWK
jgi:predicted alpha-1,2-mannosidase